MLLLAYIRTYIQIFNETKTFPLRLNMTDSVKLRVLPEKLIVVHLLSKFPVFYGTLVSVTCSEESAA